MKLKGQKAVVTGANRSIGRAIAIEFAKEGADVAISYRSDEVGAKQVVEAIKALGREGRAFYADLSSGEGVAKFFHECLSFLGAIDVLVNNACGYSTTSFLDLEASELHDLLQVGLLAAMQLTQLVSRQMIERKIAGRIINISSIGGLRPCPNRTAFSTTKAALNMLTQDNAIELAPHHIRVNGLAPGTTPYERQEETPVDIPLGRYGTPEDQAKAALFLASDESSWMTGQILTIDGGQTLSF